VALVAGEIELVTALRIRCSWIVVHPTLWGSTEPRTVWILPLAVILERILRDVGTAPTQSGAHAISVMSVVSLSTFYLQNTGSTLAQRTERVLILEDSRWGCAMRDLSPVLLRAQVLIPIPYPGWMQLGDNYGIVPSIGE